MNVQNIPRDDKVVKRAFLPKLEAIAFFDFVQIEPRLLAYFMSKLGDDSMAESYRAGEDVYRGLAADVYGKAPEDITGEERQTCKRLFLSIMYGGGVRTVTAQGHTAPEARRLIKAFYKALPGIRLVSNPRPKDRSWDWEPGAIERRVKDVGYIQTFAGRKLYPEQWGEHKLLNFLIQGSAADVMKRALIRIHGHLRGNFSTAHLISSVHDEAQIDCERHELADLAIQIPPLMDEPVIAEVVPLEVEMSVTFTSWADKAEWPFATE